MIVFISSVLILSILVFIHEFGHFIMAKWAGVKVSVFSLGFGKKLFSFKIGETEYRISIVPFGGFVRMEGEDFEVEIEEDSSFFNKKSLFWRFSIISAGPFANILFSFFICCLVVFCWGGSSYSTLVGNVKFESPAAISDIRKGDRILSIENKPVKYWKDVFNCIQEGKNNFLTFVVKRDERILVRQICPVLTKGIEVQGSNLDLYYIGIQGDEEVFTLKKNILGSFKIAFDRSYEMLLFIIMGILRIFTCQISLNDVGGPILIVKMVGQSIDYGIVPLLNLSSLISLNLALLNLLPIPVLDGGHLFFLSLEAFRGKSLDLKKQKVIERVGFLFLFLVMFFVFFNDIFQLFL